jgi:hypothetical protein
MTGRENEHVDRLAVVDEVSLPGCGPAGHQMFGGEDEAVNQVVYVGVIQLGVLAADEDFDVTGEHTFEHPAEHRLIAGAPDPTGPDRAGEQAINAVLR